MHKTIDLLNVKLGELINNNDSLGIDILETQAKNIILEKDKLIKEVLNGRWFSKGLDSEFGNTREWIQVK